MNFDPSLMATDFMLRAGSVERGITGATLAAATQPGDAVTTVLEFSFDLSATQS